MKPPVPTEHEEQVALMTWWSYAHKEIGLPEFALFAIPNGGARHIRTAGRLKAEGVRAGAPDLMLAMPTAQYHGAFIEMKRRGGKARCTPKQSDFGEFLAGVGYAHYVAHGFDQARTAIMTYLISPLGAVRLGRHTLFLEPGFGPEPLTSQKHHE